MSFYSLQSELAELKKEFENKLNSQVTFARDRNGNLKIYHGDGTFDKFPLVDLRDYQLEAQRLLFIEGYKRFMYVWPRRAGKEVVCWNMLVQGSLTRPGLYLMVYPSNVRARKILWQGSISLPENKSLKFLDMIPKEFIKGKPNQIEMTIELHNGSVIWVLGSDVDPDKLRGTNPLGIAFCEYAYCDPRVFNIMAPALRQNNGWAIVQTTFRGMNHAYKLFEQNKLNPSWICRKETVETLKDENGNRYITDEMIEEDRRSGMPEYLIQQEYFSTVEKNDDSFFFSQAIASIYETKRIIDDLMLDRAIVYAAWDIGWRDATAITLFQLDHVDTPIIIGYIENNNKTLRFYLDETKRFCTTHNLLFGYHYFPHDGKNVSVATGKSLSEHAQDYGEKCIVVDKPKSELAAIESIRQVLFKTKFNKKNTARLVDCISNYSKEFDAKLNIYKEKAVHDWSSHGVKSFQTMVLALERGLIVRDFKSNVWYYNND